MTSTLLYSQIPWIKNLERAQQKWLIFALWCLRSVEKLWVTWKLRNHKKAHSLSYWKWNSSCWDLSWGCQKTPLNILLCGCLSSLCMVAGSIIPLAAFSNTDFVNSLFKATWRLSTNVLLKFLLHFEKVSSYS